MRQIGLTGIAALALALAACAGVPPAVQPSTSPSSAPTPAGPTSTPLVTTFNVSGKVLDENVAPVAGATITAMQGDKLVTQATVASDGRYALGLGAGAYTITAEKSGFTTRTQSATVAHDLTLDFGSVGADPVNPFFLSDTPEVSGVDVKEDSPGGPLTLVMHLSEPLTVQSQENFLQHVQILSGSSKPFLDLGAPLGLLTTQNSWDAAGQTLTIHFAGPYVASGDTPVSYTVRLRQTALDTKDPVTQETQWEDLGITDAQGNALAEGRAVDAFLKLPLTPFPLSLLSNKSWGYYANEARWNLTHTSGFTFVAAKDELKPVPLSVSVVTQGETSDSGAAGSGDDVMTIHFNEPMWASKDQANPQFTRLDVTKQLLAEIDGSPNTDGSGAHPLTTLTPTRVQLSLDDPKLVQLHFTLGSFNNLRWCKIKLGPDMLDPANNAPDPNNDTASGTVG